MGYYTGSAADIAAVRTALVNACVAEGWTWDSGNEVLWKNTMFVRIQAISAGADTRLELLGRTALGSGDAPAVVSMAKMCSVAIAFPVAYFAFVFDKEVFFIINYSDMYQWCAFGQSGQAGLPGTGNWVAATRGVSSTVQTIRISPSGGGGTTCVTPALFWNHAYENTGSRNAWVHTNIEPSYPWYLTLNGAAYYMLSSAWAITELIQTQPNVFNNESVLLPVRAYKMRAENKVSQILEIENARHVRIDNYEPQDVIQLGSDKWKVFPYYKKNASVRDGGLNVDHTGTFGWAIRYEGA